jgi:hypothetical protein
MFKRKNKPELINFTIVNKEEYIDEEKFIPNKDLFNDENFKIKFSEEKIKKTNKDRKKCEYHIFLNKKIEELKETSPDKTGRERVKMAITIWNEMNKK